MTPVVYSPAHRAHAPRTEVNLGLPIPTFERPERAERIRDVLAADPDFDIVGPTDHGRAPIEAVHDPGMVRFLETAWAELHAQYGRDEFFPEVVYHGALRDGMGPAPVPTVAEHAFGYWCYETATPLAHGTYTAALASVDVALTAADLVAGGEPVAYGLCRPPGHHAAAAVYGGFCFFSNAAIVARRAAAPGHGRRSSTSTTTTATARSRSSTTSDDVQFVSLARRPACGPTRSSRASPTRPAPATAAVTRSTCRSPPAPTTTATSPRWPTPLAQIDRFGPDLVVVSLGVDTYWNDPISDLALTTEGYERCGRLVAELGLPTVVLQEGGYDLEAIGPNVQRWLRGVATRIGSFDGGARRAALRSRGAGGRRRPRPGGRAIRAPRRVPRWERRRTWRSRRRRSGRSGRRAPSTPTAPARRDRRGRSDALASAAISCSGRAVIA